MSLFVLASTHVFAGGAALCTDETTCRSNTSLSHRDQMLGQRSQALPYDTAISSEFLAGYQRGDPAYDEHGNKGHIRCFYQCGKVYLDYDSRSGGCNIHVSKLGKCTGTVEGFQIGGPAYDSKGYKGHIRCFYQDGSVYLDYDSRPGGDIVPVSKLGKCAGTVEGFQIGGPAYDAKGNKGHIRCFYQNCKAYLDYDSLPGGCILQVSELGRVNGSLGVAERAISVETRPDASRTGPSSESQLGSSLSVRESSIATTRADVEPDADLCKVCFSSNWNTVLIPCGHLVLCHDCAEKVDTCPMCRKAIRSKHRVFR